MLKRFVKRLLSCLLLAALFVLVIIGGTLGVQGWRLYRATASQKPIASLYDEISSRPGFASCDQLPQTYIDAVISVEDSRFERHHGIDPAAIVRALWADLRTRSLAEGGSTLTQQLAKQMVARGIHGRIVNFSSITAVSASATQVHYGAAKGAISSFTRMAAEALGKYGITVNAVMPGPVPTKHNSAYLAQDATRTELCGRIPMGSYGDPAYIADGVAYFLGEKACWTTGVLLPVDGGYLAK